MKVTVEHYEDSRIHYVWVKRKWWHHILGGDCIGSGFSREEALEAACRKLNSPEPPRPRKIREDVELFKVEQ